MLSRITIVLAVAFLAVSNCPGSNLVDDLYSETVFLTQQSRRNTNDLEYSIRPSQTFSATPKVALGLDGFHFLGGSEQHFAVLTERVTPSRIDLRVRSDSNVWRTFRLSVWASARADLILGTYSEELSALRDSTEILSIRFEDEIQHYRTSVSRSFLNGFRGESDSEIKLTIETRNIEEREIKVGVSSELGYILDEIWFSYMIFSPSQAAFASYGGVISETSFEGVHYKDVHRILHYSPYHFLGLSELNLHDENEINFGAKTTQQFILGIASEGQIEKFTLYYIILGVASSHACEDCDFKLGYQQRCLEECPRETYAMEYPDGGEACRPCSNLLGLELNSRQDGCVCIDNFILRNGTCQPRNINDIPSFLSVGAFFERQEEQTSQQSTETVAGSSGIGSNIGSGPNLRVDCDDDTEYWTGYRCACRVGFNNETGRCRPINSDIINRYRPVFEFTDGDTDDQCGRNEERDGRDCVCRRGYIRIRGVCERDQGSTDEQCGSNQQFDGRDCVCRRGYTRRGGRCEEDQERCGRDEIWDGRDCVCRRGFIRVRGVCQRDDDEQCGKNEVFDGRDCVCIRGYFRIRGFCERDDNSICTFPNQYFDGDRCSCLPGYTRIDGICTRETDPTNCPINGFFDGVQCQCFRGFVRSGRLCVPDGSICGPNEVDNGLGLCICRIGYFRNNFGECQFGEPCPSNSERINGECVCIVPFERFGDFCSRCPPGGRFDEATQRCIFVCGESQEYDRNLQRCVCFPGFGLYQGRCQRCPTSYFLREGHCVTCPVYATFNPRTNRCDCNPGYITDRNSGCTVSCRANEIFDRNLGRCVCWTGFTRIGGQCIQCRDGIIQNGVCIQCRENQIRTSQGCVCRAGYTRDFRGICVPCTQVTGKFLHDGSCVTCPGDLVEVNGLCACPGGETPIGSRCIQGCGDGTIDNQEECDDGDNVSGDGCSATCEVEDGYTCTGQPSVCTRDGDPDCGNGLIESGEQCDDGDSSSGDGCSSTCRVEDGYTCRGEPSVCTRNGGSPVCGNGIIESGEQCDDGDSSSGDGCSSICRVEDGYTCRGVPSVCTRDDTSNGGASLVLADPVNTNSNNIFVILRTTPTFTFDSETEMQNFIQTDFPPGAAIPTVYCTQRPEELDIFECLLIYPSGVPNFEYDVQFSFDRDGQSAEREVRIDPFNTQFSRLRSLRN